MKPSQQGFRIVVVDDDKEMRHSLKHLLTKAGWQVELFSKAEDVVRRVDGIDPDVVLADVRMPGMSGIDLLVQLAVGGAVPVVLISAHGDIPTAVQAMQQGAYSFLEKPFDPRRLLNMLQHAADQHRLRRDTVRLKRRLCELSGLDRILLGETDVLRDLREDIVDLSAGHANVLILGETGSGKELVARALHDLSPRSNQPFVAVNCAAFAGLHFEETLFGKAGATRGMTMQANGGTLFLDEIGSCSLDGQGKLLRVIETREVVPVGADQPCKVDMRIISASNERLEQAIDDGRFRNDLFFRLNTIVIDLPPLRERRDDIPLLYTHFLEEYAKLYEIAPPELSADDLSSLLTHRWPGNVRELRHVAERRVLAARRGRGSVAEAIRLDDGTSDVPETLREAVAAFERHLIGNAIRAHQGRMDTVAEALGIGRRTLNEKIVKLGLNKANLL